MVPPRFDIKNFVIFVLFIGCLMYAGDLFSQPRETPLTVDQIIEMLTQAARSLKSFSATLMQRKYFFLFDEEEVFSGKIYYQTPNKMAVHIEKPTEQFLGTDGKKGWLYLPKIKQVQMMSIESIKGKGASFIMFLINPSQFFRKGQVSIIQVIKDENDTIYKLQVLNNCKGRKKDQDFLKLVLWIRKSSPLPVMKLELTEANKDMVLYELTNIMHNPEFYKDFMKPSFPDDVEIVTY